jgi:hypothetical protein
VFPTPLHMQAITVDDVFEKVTRIYDSRKSMRRAEVDLHYDAYGAS